MVQTIGNVTSSHRFRKLRGMSLDPPLFWSSLSSQQKSTKKCFSASSRASIEAYLAQAARSSGNQCKYSASLCSEEALDAGSHRCLEQKGIRPCRQKFVLEQRCWSLGGIMTGLVPVIIRA